MLEKTLEQLLFSEINLISELPDLLKRDIDLNCVDGTIIGTGRSDFTQESTMYNLFISDKNFALIDIPGIEGDECKFEKIIQDSLEKAHTIFYVNGSGKKIEKETLKKIKKYMHDGTTVYAVFNVHCKAKKERIEGIDKSYSDELSEAYDLQQDIIYQTEAELKSIIGENFKGSISVNGLLAFCAYALDANGQTTILDEENKNLRGDQQKYLHEFSGNTQLMIRDSHIEEISEIIFEKIDNFEDYIHMENIKKLKNRLSELIEKIGDLKEMQTSRVRGFCKLYDEFESNCCHAKEDFISGVNHIATKAVGDEFLEVRETLFKKIESDKGKTKPAELQAYFNENKNKIAQNIQKNINKEIETLHVNYQNSVKDAFERLSKDLERESVKFSVSISAEGLVLDTSCIDVFNYTAKDFGKHLFTTVSLVASCAAVGSIVPGLGTIIGASVGAVIGAILGIFSSVVNFFLSEDKRINKAKEKLGRTLDDQEYEISRQLQTEIKKLNIPCKVNEDFKQIENLISVQKKNLRDILHLLGNIYTELMQKKQILE